MPLTADLREMVQAVEISSSDSFSVSGEIFQIPSVDRGNSAMTSHLASALYQRMYCRPQRGGLGRGADGRAARVFVDELSSANCGVGTWEPGWVVKTLEDDGTLIVHKQQDDLAVWAQPSEFRPSNGVLRIGTVGRLRIDKELREMIPGYYTILGDVDQATDDSDSPVAVVRFYWHLTEEAAAPWIRELTQRFNGAQVPFRAKVLSAPSAYVRADAGVLYVAHRDLTGAMALLPDLHGAISSQLRPTTPMFTKRLARGLAVAEDPGDGRSFGQHRCQLVSEGVVRAFENGCTAFLDAATSVAARFADERLSITRPWLNPGSRERYTWPAARLRA
jgi:hypothetical protein